METAFVNFIYYERHGYHRCNLSLDESLGVGVYAYTDIATLMRSLNWNHPDTANMVIGVITGYLHKHKEGKVSLDPRSCKLIAMFAQIQIPGGAPFTLGEEDKMSLRLGPADLGTFVNRFHKIWNMNGPAEAIKLNDSYHSWSGKSVEARQMIYIVEELKYNIRSRNEADQIEQ